jgi:small subunit ribosomal protein S9
MSKSQTKYFYGVGRRKASSARSKYFPSSEKLTVVINKKELAKYFPDYYSKIISESLSNLGINTGVVEIYVKGGGLTGQAEASRLAIAKSVVESSADLKPLAKSFKYLTSDNRKVLPKRPGLRKARKREQWAKR